MQQFINFMIIIWLFVSCSIPSKELDAFGFLMLEDLVLKTEESQGDSFDNFKDAWVFVNGMSNGVYEIPRKIPVSIDTDGKAEIVIQAGIRDNGVNSSPVVYPFVQNYHVKLQLTDLEIVNLTPEFEYLPETKFRMVEDFEGLNGFSYDEDKDTTTVLRISRNMPFSGQFSGEIVLNPGDTLEQGSSNIFNNVPTDGRPVYLEIDFYGDIELDIGLIGEKGGQIFKEYFVSLRSEQVWKKAYINLTSLVVASDLTGYRVVLRAINQNSEESAVYLDNIKFLHF